MSKEQGFSIEQHREHGRKLKSIRVDIMRLGIDIGKRYGVSGKLSRQAEKAQQAIEGLLHELDEAVSRENPSAEDSVITKIYYSGDVCTV